MNQAKKRLVIAITLAEPGGATSFVLRFATWLHAHGEDVTVVAGDGKWLHEQCARNGIPNVRLRHFGREISIWRDVRAFLELRFVLKNLRAEAVHLNSTKMGIVGSLAARSLGIERVVYRIGGWVFLEPLTSFRKFAYRLLERLTASLKDVIICVHPGDEAVARQEKIRPRKELVTIPNGIDLESFDSELFPRADVRQLFHYQPSDFVFVTLANFFPVKNLPLYLEACAQVSAQAQHAKFLLIGDGLERRRIEEMITRLNLTSVVTLAGEQHTAARFLSGADAFVLPSAKEGMSWALLEAMSTRLPCIATDVGANRWMLGDVAGWIVPANDATKLAATMLAVMRQPEEAAQRGALARREVQLRFPLEKTLEGNAQVLRND